MPLVIQKHGPSSLADPICVRATVARISRLRCGGTDVFVVADADADAEGLTRMRDALAATDVPVVTGDDATAIELSASLGAEACEIYTSAGGVFTADPTIVPNAQLLRRLTYSEMLAMTADGRHEPTPDAIELARELHVEMRIRPILGAGTGTVVASFVRAVGSEAHASATWPTGPQCGPCASASSAL